MALIILFMRSDETRMVKRKWQTESIFTKLMGGDVEARRNFIEDNASIVKNLDT
jgi:DNA gyrase/topoisomerase IV subunit B